MRRLLALLPVVLLHAGCDSDPGLARPQPLPVVSGPVSLSGTVYDATDEATGRRPPLSGVRVTLHAWNEDVLVEESVFAATTTDEQGRFSLSFDSRDVWLGAAKEGYDSYAVRIAAPRTGSLDIELVRR